MKYLALTIAVLSTVIARADSFTVIIESINNPVTVSVPPEFSPASNTIQCQSRDSILAYYRNNPARRGIYSSVFLKTWEPVAVYPYIVVGTLGSFRGKQGNISQETWNNLRNSALNLNAEKLKKYREKAKEIQKTSPNKESTIEELTWMDNENHPDYLVIYSQIRASTPEGAEVDLAIASKLVYKDGFVVNFHLSVDNRVPDAFALLREYTKLTKVTRIEGFKK